MKIRFTKDWTVRQGDGKGPQYKAGQEVTFTGPVEESYARKYIARELAVEVDESSAGLFGQRRAEAPAHAQGSGGQKPAGADPKGEIKGDTKTADKPK